MAWSRCHGRGPRSEKHCPSRSLTRPLPPNSRTPWTQAQPLISCTRPPNLSKMNQNARAHWQGWKGVCFLSAPVSGPQAVASLRLRSFFLQCYLLNLFLPLPCKLRLHCTCIRISLSIAWITFQGQGSRVQGTRPTFALSSARFFSASSASLRAS